MRTALKKQVEQWKKKNKQDQIFILTESISCARKNAPDQLCVGVWVCVSLNVDALLWNIGKQCLLVAQTPFSCWQISLCAALLWESPCFLWPVSPCVRACLVGKKKMPDKPQGGTKPASQLALWQSHLSTIWADRHSERFCSGIVASSTQTTFKCV